MEYWIQVNGVNSSTSLTPKEIFTKYQGSLNANTACCEVGENQWGQLSDYFPDWEDLVRENLVLEPETQPETVTATISSEQSDAPSTAVTSTHFPVEPIFGLFLGLLLSYPITYFLALSGLMRTLIPFRKFVEGYPFGIISVIENYTLPGSVSALFPFHKFADVYPYGLLSGIDKLVNDASVFNDGREAAMAVVANILGLLMTCAAAGLALGLVMYLRRTGPKS